MVSQRFALGEYGWKVHAFYHAEGSHVKEILSLLRYIGVQDLDYEEAFENLTSMVLDRGLCYSNLDKRVSVLVISPSSSPSQFMNSLIHEIRHLGNHIEKAFGINPHSEKAAYLAGTIGEKMFPKAKLFLCRCYKAFQ